MVAMQNYKKIKDLNEIKSDTTIVDYLYSLGIKPVSLTGNYALYHAPYRQDRNPSCVVYRNRNIFVDMATGERGDIFKLVQLMNGCTFKEALEKLSSDGSVQHHVIEIENIRTTKSLQRIIINEVKKITSWALKKYMMGRGISSGVADTYCKEVHYTVNDKNYYAIAFKNDSDGYELRNEFFKGCTRNDITTIQELQSGNWLVFEGFFDFLSYKELSKKSCNAIIMNSVVNINKAISKLEELKAEKIFMCADADAAGRQVVQKIIGVFGTDKVVDISGYYAKKNCKDLNELLQVKKKSKKIGL